MSESDTNEPVTFTSQKARTAKDLRQIAAFLEDSAKAIEEGDLREAERLIDDKWSSWHEMFALRFYAAEEAREAGCSLKDLIAHRVQPKAAKAKGASPNGE